MAVGLVSIDTVLILVLFYDYPSVKSIGLWIREKYGPTFMVIQLA